MKKRLLVMAMAGVALAGCVSDEVAEVAQKNELVKIAFDSPVLYDNAESRAIPGEIGVKYDKDEKFKIFAIKYNESDEYEGWGQHDVALFNGVSVSYDNSVDGWAPKHNDDYYYWEPGLQIAFAACSPAEILNTATYGASGLSIPDYTVSTIPTAQYDLLFSQRVYDAHADNMNHESTSYTGLPIIFQHALASVHIAIENETLAAVEESNRINVTLKSIKIEGLINTGSFSEGITDVVTESAPFYKEYVRKDRNNNEGNVNPTWTLGTTTDTYNVYEAGSTEGLVFPESSSHVVDFLKDEEKGGTDYGDANYNLLLPQSFGSSNTDAKIVIKYRLEGKTNDTTKEILLKDCGLTTWKMGHKYIYNLRYSLSSAKRDKIIFSPSVEGWPEPATIIDVEIK